MNSLFTHPMFLWLLFLIPLLLLAKFKAKNNLPNGIKVSNNALFSSDKNILAQVKPHLFWLLLASIFCIIIALARPRSIENNTYTNPTNGVDIVLATDISLSMLADDLLPNRLEAVKEVAHKFILKRQNDRIGIVVYAAESYTKIPLTSDKNILIEAIADVKYSGGIINDGTAIGLGLGTAINRVKDSKAKSKVVILLTDGVNNQGNLDPISAAEIAKEYGIKVYTIGVGTNGMANFPSGLNFDGSVQFTPQKVEIDEKLLQDIATLTNGKYFRATDNNKLQQIYDEIDRLEKSVVIEEKMITYHEYYRIWVILALLFLATYFILEKTIFKSFVS